MIIVALLVAAFATSGLLLSQTAYRGGLGAPLAVVTLANPVAAAVIGLTLLGQGLHGGASGVLLALSGAALASWGVVALTRATPHSTPAERPYPEPGLAGPGQPVQHDGHEAHPVAAVLALEPESASQEPALLPRRSGTRRRSGPGHLTPL
ncbi:hypothetical protein GCM10014715_62390 [Streptomyces spiralis]|uniref:Uncharacterized protein n=1 Tax=Streptomyces spiralis TaxID=66376 RepID=A0A919ACK5_9ACTN|nr:hypothetical protein GCM10014715_62390 [Streptomyces spiralis]